jgi:hypothetical protein
MYYIRLISLVQKGDRFFSGNMIGGESLRGEWPFAIDVKGGNLITLI